MKGARINQVLGSYNAGGGMVRLRNSETDIVKMLEPLAIVTEEKTREFPGVTVADNDILEAFCEAVPT